MMGKVYYIWESLRPKQWTKNLFIFAGIIFSQNFFNFYMLSKTIFAFFTFCLLSGSVYILNDIVDIEQDRHYLLKSRRPIASGRFKISHAILVLITFAFFSLTISYSLNISFFLVVLSYLLLQLAYSFYLKRIVILDVFTIACGFALRVVAGATVINVDISSWLIICTILLALFLGLSKRRYELGVLGKKAQSYKKVLGEYNPHLLDRMIWVVAISSVVAYVFYTISEETVGRFATKNLIFTIPFVLYGIFRYLYLIYRKGVVGQIETALITDKPLLIDSLLWVVTVGIILYR